MARVEVTVELAASAVVVGPMGSPVVTLMPVVAARVEVAVEDEAVAPSVVVRLETSESTEALLQ